MLELRRTPQPVEKVVVGPIGGPREPENKAETLPKRRIRPPNRAPERARRSFSTGCPLPRAPLNNGLGFFDASWAIPDLEDAFLGAPARPERASNARYHDATTTLPRRASR